MKKILLVLPIVLFFAAACNSFQQADNQTPVAQNTAPTATSTPTTSPTLTNTTTNTYQDDRVQVSVPSDWVYAQATAQTSGDATYNIPIGLKFAKNNFTLSLLTHSGQASGIKGGRLSEITTAALNLNTGMIDDCAGYMKSNSTKINNSLNRVDLYLDTNSVSNSILTDCGLKSNIAVVWLGSYFAQNSGGYFLDYPSLAGITYPFICETNCEMAFGVKMNNASLSNLPKQGDAQLAQYLNEASNIIKNVTYKTAVYVPDIYDSLKALSTYPGWPGSDGNSQGLLTCDAAQGKIFFDVIDMESLTDVSSLYGHVGNVAAINGWQKCNSSKDADKTTDAYQKSGELMNVELDNKNSYIDVLFANQNSYYYLKQ